MKKLIISALVLLLPIIAIGKTKIIEGTVYGYTKDTCIVLPCVSVKIAGTGVGTLTDENGKYSLRLPQNALLTVSCEGCKTKTVRTGGKLIVDVKLKSKVELSPEYIEMLKKQYRNQVIKK